MASINDSTARNEHLGTKDEGGRQVFPLRREEKLWKPKIYGFTSKGDPTKTFEVTGGEFREIFGRETLDPRSKYFNHPLFLANKIFKNAGEIVFKKMNVPAKRIPDPINADEFIFDETTKSHSAGFTLYALVSDTNIPNYERDVTGKIIVPKVVVTGAPTVAGHEISFVLGNHSISCNSGNVTIEQEILDGITLNGQDATLYPLFSVESKGENKYYNDIGITLKALIGPDNDFDVMEKIKAFQLGMSIVSKELGSVSGLKNVLGLRDVKPTFRPFSINPRTNTLMTVDDLIPKKWENIVNINLPLISAPIKDIRIHDGFKALVNKLAATELAYLTANNLKDLFAMGNDEWEEDDRDYAYNWISIKDPVNENEYMTAVIAPAPTVDFSTVEAICNFGGLRVVDISDNTPIYMQGGADGAIEDLELLEQALLMEIAEYGDRDSVVQSIPLNTENVFVDSGFSLDTKLKLPIIQMHRQDIELILATYEFDKEDKNGIDIAKDITIAAVLRNAISLTPESAEYNTPTSRGQIVQGCGKDADEIYPYLIPNTLELASQSSLYMGGKEWKGRYSFGGRPGSDFKALTDIRPPEMPFSIRSKLHNTGVMYAEVEDRGTWFFPTYQGIYLDPTSPLASYHVNMANTYFVKLHHSMWRKYTGRMDLSEGELKQLIEADMRTFLSLEKFNNVFEALIPEVFFLPFDAEVGHIWRQRIYTYAHNEKRVAISDNVVRRASALEGGN